MATTTYNMTVQQGATKEIDFTLKQSDESTDIPASSISIARMQVRASKTANTAVLDLDSGDKGGLTITDGNIRLEITPSDTTGISNFASGRYDIEVEYTNGKVDRIAEGAFTLDLEVTR